MINTPNLDKKETTKREIKRFGNVLGGAYAISQGAVSLVVSIVMMILMIVLPKISADMMTNMIIQIIASVIMFTFPYMISLSILKKDASEVIALSKPQKRGFFPLIAVGFAFCFVANILSSFFTQIIDGIGLGTGYSELQFPSGVLGFVVSFLGIAVIPALVEEFALRGVFLGLLKKHGEGFAIFTSAVFFGLMHTDLVQIPFAFLVGLILGFVTIKTGSVWTAVIIHFLNNAHLVILGYIQESLSKTQYAVLSSVIVLAIIVLGFFGLFRLIKNDTNIFALNEEQETVSFSGRFWTFFGSSGMIVSLSIIGLLTVMSVLLF